MAQCLSTTQNMNEWLLEFNEEKNDAELCFKTSGVPLFIFASFPRSVSCYMCYNLFNLKILMSANKNFPVHLQAPVFVPIESAKKLQLLPNWHIFRLKTPTANCLEKGMLLIGIVIQWQRSGTSSQKTAMDLKVSLTNQLSPAETKVATG